MQIIVQKNSLEVLRGQKWWNSLELSWKMAFNEALLRKGPTAEPPKDEELILLLVRATAIRFAGPAAYAPNLTQIPDNLSGLAGLSHLRYLSFTHSKVNSLQEISQLVHLESLFVYNNQLTSLTGVESMTNLTQLYAQHNRISDLKPVRKLTKLETLYMADNRLSSLEGITSAHEACLRHFYVLPNRTLKHREVIRVQQQCGILCRQG